MARKYAYVKAYIVGIKALKQVDPGVRIITTEPLVSVTGHPLASAQDKENAALENQLQFQVLDMLSGRICPELGGKEDYLDIIGCNYYYNNQWIRSPYEVLTWNHLQPHENYREPSSMMYELFQRYNRPLLLSETSHPGVDRPIWVRYIAHEVSKLLKQDIPFWGICWYPVIDRPDWDNLDEWHHAGIWDRISDLPEHQRVLHQPTAHALKEVQEILTDLLLRCKHQNFYEIDSISTSSL